MYFLGTFLIFGAFICISYISYRKFKENEKKEEEEGYEDINNENII